MTDTAWIDQLADALDQATAQWVQKESVELQPHQMPPDPFDKGWVLLAGRGAGKSWAGMHWLNERCEQESGLRARIIAPTLGDGVASCVEGPNGLLAASGHRAHWNPSAPGGAVVSYSNDSKVWVIGTPGPRDVDRLRALTNIEIDVFEEAFANPRLAEAWEQAELSRRRGNPRFVVTSTPRPHPLIREWTDDPGVHLSRAITSDNKFLHPDWVQRQRERLAGTRLFRQEFLGEVIDDVEGALWTQIDIDRSVCPRPDELVKTVVGVDPPSGSGTCGIVVVGADLAGHIYVLADYSLTDVTPNEWALAVAAAAKDFDALVVAEVNQGGRMVTEVLRAAAPDLAVTTVNAAKGKQARAEPIALLWEAELQAAHMCPQYPEDLAQLIDQMLGWVPGSFSPDRLDAMVWAATYLRGKTGFTGSIFVPGRHGTIPKRTLNAARVVR
jgi:phage terminase large subunit-like protein